MRGRTGPDRRRRQSREHAAPAHRRSHEQTVRYGWHSRARPGSRAARCVDRAPRRRGTGPRARRRRATSPCVCSSAATRASRSSGSSRSWRAGSASEGARVVSVGVIPTPGVAYLTRSEGFDAGIVISASHNPYEDNGIKMFSGRGEKLDEGFEARIEAIVADAVVDASPARRRRRRSSDRELRGALRRAPAERFFRDAERLARQPHRDRLRQWRDDDDRADAVSRPRASSRGHRRPAERPQHQSRTAARRTSSLLQRAVRRASRRGSASRSMATAIARCSSIAHGNDRRRRRGAADRGRCSCSARAGCRATPSSPR